MLEFGIALLAWFVRLAVVIEAGDREPSTVATCLTSLRIETSGKGILFGKDGAIAPQVILVDAALIHPQAQALVADELDGANGFLNSAILRFGAIDFVFVDNFLRSPRK